MKKILSCRLASLLSILTLTPIASQTRTGIARLNPDGTLDPTLAANASETIMAIAIQQDGKIVIAGAFTSVASVTRKFSPWS